MKQKPNVGIVSLGCPRNLVDSENILGRLNLKGYPIVDIDRADIAVVNTCGFIQDAKKESIEVILDLIELKKERKIRKIIVYGCLSQRYKDVLAKELPEVDAFVGKISLNHNSHLQLTPHHFAYLKIAEGCVSDCSFCVIPTIKGKFTSLPVDSVVRQAVSLDAKGVRELNIIGQDITGYGIDLYGTSSLDTLVEKIAGAVKNVRWLRLLYLSPHHLSDALLDLIKSEQRICKYIDLPLQHINSRILKLMNRKTTKQEILKLIEKIRKIIPQVGIRTSLIVGFPSETEKEFDELLRFVKAAQFERLGVFMYSREEGTKAYSYKDQVGQKIKAQRFNAVMALQQEVSRQVNKKFLGNVLEVLIDEKENGCFVGRSQYDAPEVDGVVYVHAEEDLLPGDFVRVKITDTLEYDLIGEPVR